MKCTPELHVYEFSEDHDFNRPEGSGGNCRSFPVGHLCLCGEKAYTSSVLDETIKPDSMIAKICGSVAPIETANNALVPSFRYKTA